MTTSHARLLLMSFGLMGCLGHQRAALANNADDVYGTWDVRLKANFSSCASARVGDVNALQLVLRRANGMLIAETVGNTNAADQYFGDLTNGTLRLQSVSQKSHQATIEATLSGKTMTGRRVVANDAPLCSIIYELTGKKL